jgi:hypothetical protein
VVGTAQQAAARHRAQSAFLRLARCRREMVNPPPSVIITIYDFHFYP